MTEKHLSHLDLTSDYDCSQSNQDVPRLKHDLAALQSQYPDLGTASLEVQQQLNHLENQLSFIKNKCRLS